MQGLAGLLGDAEIEQVVREMRTGQELRGEIRDAARIRAAVVFHALDRARKSRSRTVSASANVEIVLRRRGLEPAHLRNEGCRGMPARFRRC